MGEIGFSPRLLPYLSNEVTKCVIASSTVSHFKRRQTSWIPRRLWAGSGNLLTGGPYTWSITDFDVRRHFSVTYSPPARIHGDEELEATAGICRAKLRDHIDDRGPDVLGIGFSDPSGPITVSSDIKDDATFNVNCQQVPALRLPFAVKTIGVEDLTELERLGPEVDLVTYPAQPTVNAAGSWYELQCWSRLPRDDLHIVPFDAVVVDPRGGVLGFTSVYVPGGTLWHNNATRRPFRLVWLRQLLSVVDDLNYQYGVMHQDVAPRNLVVDENDNLCIFDFNYAIMIKEHYSPDRDDVNGVIFTLYEIITLDESLRRVPHEEQDAKALLQRGWVKHPDVRLDGDVQDFRRVLDEWVAGRSSCRGEFPVIDTCIHWPWMPKDPEALVRLRDPDGVITGTERKPLETLWRRELTEMQEPYWSWERPASCRLKDALLDRRS